MNKPKTKSQLEEETVLLRDQIVDLQQENSDLKKSSGKVDASSFDTFTFSLAIENDEYVIHKIGYEAKSGAGHVIETIKIKANSKSRSVAELQLKERMYFDIINKLPIIQA